MSYKVDYEIFCCEFKNQYTFNIPDAIPARDAQIIKSMFVTRNKRQDFYSKKYIAENIENIVFAVLNEGAALFSSINSNDSNKGISRYFGVYISNAQLEQAWYFMDNILWNFVSKVDCFSEPYFSEQELIYDQSDWNPCESFVKQFARLKQELLCGPAIRSFAIGYQLASVPYAEQMQVYDCGTVSGTRKLKGTKISFGEIKSIFDIDKIVFTKYEGLGISVWQQDGMRKLKDREYRELCKEIKQYKKDDPDTVVWSIDYEGNSIDAFATCIREHRFEEFERQIERILDKARSIY